MKFGRAVRDLVSREMQCIVGRGVLDVKGLVGAGDIYKVERTRGVTCGRGNIGERGV